VLYNYVRTTEFLEKLLATYLVKKFLAFDSVRRTFITEFTEVGPEFKIHINIFPPCTPRLPETSVSFWFLICTAVSIP